jgi:hypothetical protein
MINRTPARDRPGARAGGKSLYRPLTWRILAGKKITNDCEHLRRAMLPWGMAGKQVGSATPSCSARFAPCLHARRGTIFVPIIGPSSVRSARRQLPNREAHRHSYEPPPQLRRLNESQLRLTRRLDPATADLGLHLADALTAASASLRACRPINVRLKRLNAGNWCASADGLASSPPPASHHRWLRPARKGHAIRPPWMGGTSLGPGCATATCPPAIFPKKLKSSRPRGQAVDAVPLSDRVAVCHSPP